MGSPVSSVSSSTSASTNPKLGSVWLQSQPGNPAAPNNTAHKKSSLPDWVTKAADAVVPGLGSAISKIASIF